MVEEKTKAAWTRDGMERRTNMVPQKGIGADRVNEVEIARPDGNVADQLNTAGTDLREGKEAGRGSASMDEEIMTILIDETRTTEGDEKCHR